MKKKKFIFEDILNGTSTTNKADIQEQDDSEKKFVVKELITITGGNKLQNNLNKQETIINEMISKGYRLHTINTLGSGVNNSYIRTVMYFEKID